MLTIFLGCQGLLSLSDYVTAVLSIHECPPTAILSFFIPSLTTFPVAPPYATRTECAGCKTSIFMMKGEKETVN